MARQGQTFWIRVIGGGAGIFTLASLMVAEVQVGPYLGGRIFAALNLSMMFTILLVGPVITADCIAQEKREGTLGLLFLAPLTGRDIVLSKLAINAVRAFTLLLAVLPMMVLPVLLGGVPSQLLFWAILSQISALCIALSAGMLASTLHREFIQAAVWAVLYSLGFTIGIRVMIAGIGARWLGMHLPYVVCGAGLGLMWLVTVYAGGNLKKRWEREGADFKPALWVRLFSDSEMWRAIFTWDTRKARSAHPIAWLQEYSWTARLAKWGWCALALAGELLVLVLATASGRDRGYHLLLGSVVVLGMALSGANSFRTERMTGAMELLLVTPLTPLKLIGGRLWGVWVHFFPAVAIIGFLWLGGQTLFRGRPYEGWLLVSSYIFLPMVGLYISMFHWNVLVAWLVIFLGGAVAPYYFVRALGASPLEHVVLVGILQGLAGLGALFALHEKLRSRNFVLQNV